MADSVAKFVVNDPLLMAAPETFRITTVNTCPGNIPFGLVVLHLIS
jgi:hypothetical protein